MMSRFHLLEPWRSRLLWISLGLNLAAAVHFGSHAVLQHHPQRPSFDNLVQRMAHGLPPPDAAAFRADMDHERPWYDLGRRRLAESRTEVADSVATQPFDPEKVRAALQAMQQRLHESAARFDDSLVMALAKLSPEGRAALANQLRRGPR